MAPERALNNLLGTPAQSLVVPYHSHHLPLISLFTTSVEHCCCCSLSNVAACGLGREAEIKSWIGVIAYISSWTEIPELGGVWTCRAAYFMSAKMHRRGPYTNRMYPKIQSNQFSTLLRDHKDDVHDGQIQSPTNERY